MLLQRCTLRDAIESLEQRPDALQRRLDRNNSTSNSLSAQNGSDAVSMGSRTSSNNSLQTLGLPAANDTNSTPVPATPSTSATSTDDSAASAHASTSNSQLPAEADAPLVQFVDVDKQVLVEKIVRLQKTHARKREKLAFLEEHVNQLVNELQRKTR